VLKMGSPTLCGATSVWHHLCVAPPLCGTTSVWHHLCVAPPLCGTTCSSAKCGSTQSREAAMLMPCCNPVCVGLARTPYIPVILAGKSPNTRSYTVYVYSSGHPWVCASLLSHRYKTPLLAFYPPAHPKQ